jgi:hypothetical protein
VDVMKRQRKFKGLDARTALPFLATAFAWLGLGAIGLFFWEPEAASRPAAWSWMVGFWGFCVADLYALARTVFAVLAVAAEESAEARAKLSIQALFWGILKLGCLGLFTLVLIRHGTGIPAKGLLLGLGTLIVVPIVGGYWWSQRS